MGGVSAALAASTIPTLAVLGPAGVALLLVAGVGVTVGWVRRLRIRAEKRQEALANIDTFTRGYIDALREQAGKLVELRVGDILKEIDNEIRLADASIETLEGRLGSSEVALAALKADQLSDLAERNRTLMEQIKADIGRYRKTA